MSYAEIYQRLLRGIETLPEDEARVLRAYYVDSHPWNVLPYVLRMSPVTVERLYRQGTSKLTSIVKGLQV